MLIFYTQAVALITFAQILLISCANFDPQQYALANALQSILSSGNIERAMQIIEMATNQQIGKAPCLEEKAPISSPQSNRRLLPIGALQRLAAPNLDQFIIKQTPQYSQANVPVNMQNIAEVVPHNALPMQNSVTSTSKYTMPNVPLIIATREVSRAPTVKEASCPCASQTLVNPFLPAASPISALSPPTSSLLPSAFPMQSRGHFLRKIPIPPPTL